MSGKNEVELTFKTDDLGGVRERALSLGFLPEGKKHQKDTFHIRQGTARDGSTTYLRVRSEDGTCRLEYHKTVSPIECEETEVSIRGSDERNVSYILEEIGYPVLIILEKDRETLRKGEFILTLDDVKGLGTYVEIETRGTESEKRPALEQVARELGFNPGDAVLAGYVNMLAERTP